MRLTRLVVLLVILITATGFGLLYYELRQDLEAQTLQATEEAMVELTHLAAGVVETTLQPDGMPDATALEAALRHARMHPIDATIYGHKKTSLGINFYLTDPQGIVIHDTSKPENIGKDFSQYNDVLLALRDRYAVRSSRMDEANQHSSILHVACPIKAPDGKIQGVISLYKPQEDVRPFIEKRQRILRASFLLMAIGVGSFIVAVFIWLFRPLGKLTEYARAITRGDRPAFPRLGRGREANTLGRALREMRQSLDGRSYTENYTRMLTHELKSPLAAIKGAAELLAEEMPADQREKFHRNIRLEAERSTQIIDGLLKLAQLEATPELKQLTTIPLSALISEICDHLQARAATKQVKMTTEITQELYVQGDRNMLYTAISNLLENALHFSPNGSTIHISVDSSDQEVRISISDQGPGIPEYALERVFEHFYSLPPSSATAKGSGLGLVFVQEVAKLHRGHATLKNQPTGGACATITLPL